MSRQISAFIEVIVEICEEKNIRVVASESLKGGLIAGVSSALGGLILGPVGLALGAAIGGAAAATSAHGKFKPVAVVIMNMTQAQKLKLYNKIEKAVKEIGYEGFISLSALILSTPDLKKLAIQEVVKFLKNDMNLSIRQ